MKPILFVPLCASAIGAQHETNLMSGTTQRQLFMECKNLYRQ